MSYDPEQQLTRYARSEKSLIAAGGRRITVRLQPDAARRLAELMRRNKVDQTTAINSALLTAPATLP
jgi:hypothetical protein